MDEKKVNLQVEEQTTRWNQLTLELQADLTKLEEWIRYRVGYVIKCHKML